MSIETERSACRILHNKEERWATLPHFPSEVHLLGAIVGNVFHFPQYEDCVEGTLLHFFHSEWWKSN